MAARENTPFPGYYAELSENPYTSPRGNPFDWSYRSRILGGRTLHWGRQSLRFAEFDFKPASMDGVGIDWPFSYQDLEPYYDKVEEYIGVQGFYEGLSQIPDGKFQPAFAYNCFEHLMRKAARKMDRRLTALRIAQLSRPHRGRPACHCRGSCGAGCDVDAFFSTPAVTLPDAMATGKLTLQTDSVARHVMVDKEARATGVGYFDRVRKGLSRSLRQGGRSRGFDDRVSAHHAQLEIAPFLDWDCEQQRRRGPLPDGPNRAGASSGNASGVGRRRHSQ